jgi:hypothetical protein
LHILSLGYLLNPINKSLNFYLIHILRVHLIRFTPFFKDILVPRKGGKVTPGNALNLCLVVLALSLIGQEGTYELILQKGMLRPGEVKGLSPMTQGSTVETDSPKDNLKAQ